MENFETEDVVGEAAMVDSTEVRELKRISYESGCRG